MASPRRFQPTPQQFRRRRIAVLVILALLGWGIYSVVGWVGSFFTAGASPQHSTQQAGAECAPNSIVVKAFVGDGTSPQSSFQAGTNPYLWFSITNTSSAECTFSAGSDVSRFKITSGSETIWDQKQCLNTNYTSTVVTLKAGETLSSTPMVWERVRSSDTGCQAATEVAAEAGGSSYHLVATVNGVVSTEDVQFILN